MQLVLSILRTTSLLEILPSLPPPGVRSLCPGDWGQLSPGFYNHHIFFVGVVQLLSHIRLFSNFMDCSMPGFPVLHHLLELLKFMPIESVMPSNHLVLDHPLLLLPSMFPSIRVFYNELALLIRWPKYWSFSFSIRLLDLCNCGVVVADGRA